MSDRYLLESGSPDGYLLEDGSGVLMIEEPDIPAAVVTDDYDVVDHESGFFETIPVAILAAVTAGMLALLSFYHDFPNDAPLDSVTYQLIEDTPDQALDAYVVTAHADSDVDDEPSICEPLPIHELSGTVVDVVSVVTDPEPFDDPYESTVAFIPDDAQVTPGISQLSSVYFDQNEDRQHESTISILIEDAVQADVPDSFISDIEEPEEHAASIYDSLPIHELLGTVVDSVSVILEPDEQDEPSDSLAVYIPDDPPAAQPDFVQSLWTDLPPEDKHDSYTSLLIAIDQPSFPPADVPLPTVTDPYDVETVEDSIVWCCIEDNALALTTELQDEVASEEEHFDSAVQSIFEDAPAPDLTEIPPPAVSDADWEVVTEDSLTWYQTEDDALALTLELDDLRQADEIQSDETNESIFWLITDPAPDFTQIPDPATTDPEDERPISESHTWLLFDPPTPIVPITGVVADGGFHANVGSLMNH